MLKKIKIILVFASFALAISMMSNTYSRYVADSTSNVDALLANWQILVNNTDITTNSSSNVTFTPTINNNENVKAGYVAPSSTGYFDININPTNVDVSFKYSINLNIDNENMPDLMITKYAFVPKTYIEGDALSYTNLNNNLIENTLYFDNTTNDFSFQEFTIRVFFEWYEGQNEQMNDEADSVVGTSAATEDTNFSINASIAFEQILSE